MDNLPYIRIDRVLAQLGLEEGTKVKSHAVIKAMWAYIKKNNLKV